MSGHHRRRMLRIQVALAASGLVALLGAGPASADGDPVLVGAGDIGTCKSHGDRSTARLVEQIDGTVFTAGDNAYDRGTALQYAKCYDPTWGSFRARTRPSPGNHDYKTPGAAGYFGYFGSRAGPKDRGWYAYNLGTWRIYSLNSLCGSIGGCGPGSPEETWLRADLDDHPHACVLAYWHHPLFSSGEHGNQSQVKPLWDVLYEHGAEVVISGHDHDYERFARMTSSGVRDTNGIREFVVGTGGRSHVPIVHRQPNSMVRNDTTFGVLKLTLQASGYTWEFIPVAGKTFIDSGTGTCH